MTKIDFRLKPGASPVTGRRFPVWTALFFIAFLLMAPALLAQTNRISGVVKDEKGLPLPGVSVVLKGTSTGVSANTQGEYSINAPATGVLEFSFIGYQTLEEPVGSRTTINVNLREDAQQLDEVVVVGYGTMRKVDLTGTVASVQGSDLVNIPVATAAEAITGKLAGVQVTTTSGAPDADIRIRVRGGGSITQDNSPLYIIDGFPVDNGLSLISPSDIERIDVLKDASSTAIYGARGANGVVIITTKGGKNALTTVNFNAYMGTRSIVDELDMMKPYDYVVSAWERTRMESYDLNTKDMQSFITRYGDFDSFKSRYGNDDGRNWQDEMFRNAMTQNYNMTISGGNNTVRYNMGAIRNIDEGVLLGSSYNRTILNGKVEFDANDRLTVGFSTRYNHNSTMGGGVSTRNAAEYRPTEGLSGNMNLDDFDSEYQSMYDLINPVLLSQRLYSRRIVDNFNLMGELSYKLGDFVFKTQAGFDDNRLESRSHNGKYTKLYLQNAGVTAGITTTETKKWINTNTLNWTKTFDDIHHVSAMIGQEWSDSQSRSVAISAKKFPEYFTPDQVFANMSTGTADNHTTKEWSYQLFSFFGRVSYDYKSKYLFNASLRADGSSNFMKGNRWGYFPSVGAAWRISEEDFMQTLPQFSNLKLRYSFGIAGNDRIGALLWTTQWITDSTTQYGIDNVKNPAYKPDKLASPNIKWETTISNNIGLDIGLFNNRLNITADFYNNKVKDLLLDAPLPAHVGFSTQMLNVGETRNRGFELVLDGVIIDKRDFTLSAGANISFNRSKVLQLNGQSDVMYISSGYATSGPTNEFRVRVGEQLGQLYGYTYDGWYTTDDFVDGTYNQTTKSWDLKSGVTKSPVNNPRPGDLKLRDMPDSNGNYDGVINSSDMSVIGNTTPKHFGGFNVALRYKNLDFRADFNWSYGNDVYNATKITLYNGTAKETNKPVEMINRYTNIDASGAPITNLSAMAQTNTGATMYAPYRGANILHSGLVEDGSFLRLNNLTIGYTFPREWMEKIRVKNLRIYVTATNLFCITNYSGYDPEVDAFRSNPITFGVDNWGYPRNRSFIGGLNITF